MPQRMDRIFLWLLCLLAFFLPLSTTAISVTACLLFACWLLDGNYREKFHEMRTSGLGMAVFAYLVVLLIGLGWTDSLHDGMAAIHKQWKVLLAPVFLTMVRWQWRWRYVGAFIAGITLTMLVIELDTFGVLQHGLVPEKHFFHTDTVQLQYTPMLAFALYLLAHRLWWHRDRTWAWWGGLGLTVILLSQFFQTMGRAGYSVFFVLLIVLVFQKYRDRALKAGLILALLLPLVFTAAYRFSPMFQQRITAGVEDIRTFHENPKTAVGLRLHYWQITWQMIRQSPWFGVGTGDFAKSYAALNNAISPDVPTTNNPHNQYLFLTAQLGLPGLLCLLALMAIHVVKARQEVDGWEDIRLAFPIFFMVIMCFESYLNLEGTGFFYSLMSAILFKKPPQDESMVLAEAGGTPPSAPDAG